MRLHHPVRAATAPSTSARPSRVCHVQYAPRNGCRSSPSAPTLLLHSSPTVALGQTRRVAVVAKAGAVNASTDAITKALEMLEAERDEASKTAESCAKTCVRLAEMVKLLDDLALEKVKAGDEAGAKAVLEEKKSIRDVLDKTSVRAQSNYALAAKLAQKIGEKQNELLAAMRSVAGAPSSFSGGAGYRSSSSSTSTSSSSGAAYGSSTSYGTGGGGSASSSAGAPQQYVGSGYSPRPSARPQWQASLEESLKRVKEQESDAQVAGRYARQSAEESVAAAKARLAARVEEDIVSAAKRVRRNPDESITQAQQRLRQRDAELLAYCQRIVARFRRGEWVDDDELEFAFKMLEKRMA